MPKPANLKPGQVPLKYARNMLQVVAAQGYNPAELLHSLQFPVDPLAADADRDAMIDARLYTRLYRRVMWLLQDESFGLGLRQRTPAGSFRMLALFIIHCETLGQALQRAAEFMSFCRTLTDTPSGVKYPVQVLEDGSARFRFPDDGDLAGSGDVDQQRYTTAHTMAIWRRFCQWLIGKPLDLRAVHLQAPEPDKRAYFDQLFDTELVFGAEHNAFFMPSYTLDCPLVRTEDSLRRFLRDAPYHLLVSPDEDDSTLLSQMKRIVGNDLSHEFPSVVAMADRLHMSVRTLRRRLKEHGTTYQQFKDELRREHAMRWLNQPELKINAISALLGFDEPSAFHRSFKKWTGMTPGEYRASRQSLTHDTVLPDAVDNDKRLDFDGR